MLPAGKLTWKTGFGYSPPLATCASLGCRGSCQVSPDNEGERRSVVPDSLQPHGLYSPRGSPGQNPGVGSLSLLQGVFPTQESNPGLPHCRQILYQLSYQGSPRTLEWVAYTFSSGSSPPRNGTKGLLHCRQILYQLRHQRSPHSLFISLKSSSTVPEPMLGAKGTKTRNAGHICCILADSVDMSWSKLRSW